MRFNLRKMMNSKPLKICIIGPVNTGKTLLAKALAEQSFSYGDYTPTSGVRIQEIERTVLGQRVNVQLWDCGGGIQFEPLWPVMAKGLEGVIMVYDGKKQEQEKELERIYVKYAQPARLNITQCLIIATDTEGTGFGPGLTGKLQKLTMADLDLSEGRLQDNMGKALAALDKLLEGCIKTRQRSATSGA